MLVFDSLVQCMVHVIVSDAHIVCLLVATRCMVHVVVSDAHIVCLLVATRWLPLQSLGPMC